MNKTLAAVLGSLSLTACNLYCIARGTLVSTPRGKRPIEDLIAQDTVWCIDPQTGEQVASPITAVVRATREVMRLSGENFVLTCTTDHPLYDPEAKSWSPAGDWVLGSRTALLLVPGDGAPTRVVKVLTREVSAGISEVFDVTVAHELHNFVAGDVLVHNKSPVRQSCEVQPGVTQFEGDNCARAADAGSGFVTCASNPDGGASLGACESTP
jgi:hypothetical protein